MTDEKKDAAAHRINLTRPIQTHILAMVLRSPGMMARCRPMLNPDYFDDAPVSDMIAWTANFWDEHKQLPSKQALLDVFRDQVKLVRALWLQELSDTEHTFHRIADFARVRAMRIAIFTAGAIISAQMKGEEYRDPETGKVTDVDPVDLVDKASKVGRDTSDLGDEWAKTMEKNLAEILNPTERDLFKTGLAHLDQAGVVIERGEVGCVLGASKRGKSHVLVNIAYEALLSGRNVVYYSLEMRNFRVFKRFYTRLAGRKQDVKADPTAFVQAVRERNQRLVTGRMIMKRYPAGTASAADLSAHLSTLAASGFKPDLVIVDYAAIMRPNKDTKDRRLDTESIFVDLRGLAADHDVGLWTGAQANRGSVNKDLVTMQDFAECFAIIGHIDVGFSICMTDVEKANHEGRFFVLGSRNEQDGCVVPFRFDYSRSLIETTGEAKPAAEKKRDGGAARSTDETRANSALRKASAAEKNNQEQP